MGAKGAKTVRGVLSNKRFVSAQDVNCNFPKGKVETCQSGLGTRKKQSNGTGLGPANYAAGQGKYPSSAHQIQISAAIRPKDSGVPSKASADSQRSALQGKARRRKLPNLHLTPIVGVWYECCVLEVRGNAATPALLVKIKAPKGKTDLCCCAL